ncbi:hypothetical protein GCM10010361_15590 [Streptomyces olivaceiscleroticus]|uniref:Uncharacterized protein n=1 Tax=Streptomyces olivaceiscleroticus TaxID=68245 RepID=A0ABN0ZM16_9ACTN
MVITDSMLPRHTAPRVQSPTTETYTLDLCYLRPPEDEDEEDE